MYPRAFKEKAWGYNIQARGATIKDYFHFFVCPECGSVTVSECSAICCCGKQLDAIEASPATDEEKLDVSLSDGELLLTSHLSQTKDDYIGFLCLVSGQRYEYVRLFPEWDVNVRFAKYGKGRAKLFFFRTGCRKLMFQTV